MVLRALQHALVNKHSQIAATVLPLSVAFGFFYTVQHGTSPLTDARRAVAGEGGQAPGQASTVAYRVTFASTVPRA